MKCKTLLTIGVVATGFGVLSMACGNGIEEAESPELQVVNDTIELDTMGPDQNSRVQDSLVLENQGRGVMEIQSLEWVTQPTRLNAYHEGELAEADEDVVCQSNDDCSEGAICLTQSNNCRDRGFRPLPHDVRQDATFSQPLIVEASQTEVECPEAPEGPDIPSGYCGEIRVETNAINDGGTATIYIVRGEGSGVLEIPDTWIQFTLAAPGVTQTRDFDLRNGGTAPLEMERINYERNEHWFEITPAMSSTVIDPGATQTFTLEMTPPDGTPEEDLDFEIDVGFESSAGFSPQMRINVTPGIGDAPRIEVEPMQLSFEDGNEQTLTVKNYGFATLPLNSMELRPVGAIDDFYEVHYEGTNILEDTSALPNVGPATGEEEPTVEEFTVVFDPPTDGSSAVGELRINHQDSLANNRTEVALLGDAAEVAIGELGPSQLNFRSDGGEQERLIAVYNQGNADLEITDVTVDEQNEQTDADDYDIDGLSGMVVAPGAVGQATVTYTGSNQFSQHLRLLPDSNHAGQSQAMQIDVLATNVSPPTMEVEIVPSFPAAAEVDQLTSFSVVDETGVGRLDVASWYLHETPDGSQAQIEGSGEQAAMVPDVAGEYRVSVVVRDADNREVQEVLDFSAQ